MSNVKIFVIFILYAVWVFESCHVPVNANSFGGWWNSIAPPPFTSACWLCWSLWRDLVCCFWHSPLCFSLLLFIIWQSFQRLSDTILFPIFNQNYTSNWHDTKIKLVYFGFAKCISFNLKMASRKWHHAFHACQKRCFEKFELSQFISERIRNHQLEPMGYNRVSIQEIDTFSFFKLAGTINISWVFNLIAITNAYLNQGDKLEIDVHKLEKQ